MMISVNNGALEFVRQGFWGSSDKIKGNHWCRCFLSPLFNCQSLDTNQSENPASAPSAKAGLWKTAAIRPVIVFLGGSYPERTVECCSDQPLPSLELVTHKTHKWPPTRSLSHAKQKGPHSLRIPTRGHILQQGKSGILRVHWGLAENDTSSAEGLISSVCVFLSLSLQYLHPSIHLYLPLCFPLSSSLPVDLGGFIWSFGIVFTVLWRVRRKM